MGFFYNEHTEFIASILNHHDVPNNTLETCSGNGNPDRRPSEEICSGHPLAQGGAGEMPYFEMYRT